MPKQATKPPKPIKVAFGVDLKEDTPSYYVNFMSVSHTPYELAITAARIPNPYTAEQLGLIKKGEPVPLEPILQLIVPAPVAEGLVKALSEQLEKYAMTVQAQREQANGQKQRHN